MLRKALVSFVDRVVYLNSVVLFPIAFFRSVVYHVLCTWSPILLCQKYKGCLSMLLGKRRLSLCRHTGRGACAA